MDASCKKSLCNDFLRRHYPHQVIGSKFGYFLSACKHKLPCIYSVKYYTPKFVKIQWFFEKIKNLIKSGIVAVRF